MMLKDWTRTTLTNDSYNNLSTLAQEKPAPTLSKTQDTFKNIFTKSTTTANQIQSYREIFNQHYQYDEMYFDRCQ